MYVYVYIGETNDGRKTLTKEAKQTGFILFCFYEMKRKKTPRNMRRRINWKEFGKREARCSEDLTTARLCQIHIITLLFLKIKTNVYFINLYLLRDVQCACSNLGIKALIRFVFCLKNYNIICGFRKDFGRFLNICFFSCFYNIW